MGGKSSKKQTVGYHYKWAMHFGWCRNADALLELRAGGATAWSGRATSNTVLSIDKPDLWGGEKGEGGVVGDLEVLFGGPTQAPSSYLTSVFGAKQSGNRGKVTTIFKGGRYGAFVPNPKPMSAKFERIHAGWEGGEAWYPGTAAIQLLVPSSLALYIAMDTSGSMATETSNGDTRLENMQSAVNAALDFVRDSVIGAGATVDIHLVAWADAHSATSKLGAAAGDIATLQAWVSGRSANGGTDFREAFADLASFASSSSAERKIAIFMTDGTPNAPAAEVAAEARDLVLAVGDVDVFAANIDQASTTYTAYVDTTPADGVPVIAGGDPGKLTNIIVSSITGGLVGMNPAHIIYEAITHPEMMGEPAGLVSAASFEAAADKLFGEAFGLCTEYDSDQETPEQFIQRICNIIGASCSQSRIDGLYYLDLIRDDYALEDLPVFTEDDILEWKHTPSVNTEAVNCIKVAWRDPQAKEDRTTAPVYAMGRIRDAGEVIAETRTYREIPVESLALRVARRDVDATSAPLTRFELTVRRKHRDLRVGRAFRLQAPSRGFAEVVCRLGDINHGTHLDGRVRIVAVQDVFALPDTVHTATTPGEWVPPDSTPAPAAAERVFEAPYVELAAALSAMELDALEDDAGYLQTVAAIPPGGVRYAIASAAAGEDLVVRAAADWCPTADVAGAAGFLDTALTLANGSLLDRVSAGTWALWDDEIVRVDSIDAAAGTVVVGRGCADTVPAPHADGSRIWFCGDWTGTDEREYVADDVVTAKLLTVTSSGQLDAALAAALDVTMMQRAARPYPPGNVLIDGVGYPTAVDDAFVVTWAHRNRTLQVDQLVDTTSGTVTPEPNTRYGLRFLDDSDAVLVERTDIGPGTATVSLNYTGDVTMELYTIDNDGESLQRHALTFAYTGTVGNTIEADAYTPVDDSTIIDGGEI